MIISIKPVLSKGSLLTQKLARKHGNPVLHIRPGTAPPGKVLARFVAENRIAVLNVAGPRASGEPEVGKFVAAVLEEMLGDLVAESSITKGRTHFDVIINALLPWKAYNAMSPFLTPRQNCWR